MPDQPGPITFAILQHYRDKKTNVYALINIGRTGILAQDELGTSSKVNKEALFDAVHDLPDFIVGIKARESHSVVIDNGIKPLLAAKSYAALLGNLPVMVHGALIRRN